MQNTQRNRNVHIQYRSGASGKTRQAFIVTKAICSPAQHGERGAQFLARRLRVLVVESRDGKLAVLLHCGDKLGSHWRRGGFGDGRRGRRLYDATRAGMRRRRSGWGRRRGSGRVLRRERRRARKGFEDVRSTGWRGRGHISMREVDDGLRRRRGSLRPPDYGRREAYVLRRSIGLRNGG